MKLRQVSRKLLTLLLPMLVQLHPLSAHAGAAVDLQAPTAPDIEAKIEGIARETDPAKLELLDRQLVSEITRLHNEKKLKPLLYAVGRRAQTAGKLPARISSDNLGEFIDQLDDMIDAELQMHGSTRETGGTRYRDWSELAAAQLAEVGKSALPPAGPGAPSRFTDPRFLRELEALAGSSFFTTEEARALINGPNSFPLRRRLMERATRNIHVFSWAFEDDTTGEVFSKLLIKRFREGVDVKVVVDWKTAELSGYHKNLEAMEKAGVPVIRWKNPQRPYFGLHRKVLIVDDQHVIAGGMNFGDVYSHMGDEKGPKWRDTDLYLKGNAALHAEALFAGLWNEQIASRKLAFPRVEVPAIAVARTAAQGPAVVIIDHVPNPEGNDTIMLAVLKAIEGATSSIDIANAYYIKNPALESALLAARARGVRVRLFTNSADSVDEPIISKPIVNSLPPLIEKGVEVYVKTGATLHSKVMVIDSLASFVMSYNFHPQSLRTQGEVAFLVVDKKLARELTDAYEKDLAGARKISDAAAIRMQENALDFIVSRYFFDQL